MLIQEPVQVNLFIDFSFKEIQFLWRLSLNILCSSILGSHLALFEFIRLQGCSVFIREIMCWRWVKTNPPTFFFHNQIHVSKNANLLCGHSLIHSSQIHFIPVRFSRFVSLIVLIIGWSLNWPVIWRLSWLFVIALYLHCNYLHLLCCNQNTSMVSRLTLSGVFQ